MANIGAKCVGIDTPVYVVKIWLIYGYATAMVVWFLTLSSFYGLIVFSTGLLL